MHLTMDCESRRSIMSWRPAGWDAEDILAAQSGFATATDLIEAGANAILEELMPILRAVCQQLIDVVEIGSPSAILVRLLHISLDELREITNG
jgi:hypothetical protein